MYREPPSVSIIIPVKNEEGILGRCLESLRALDYPPECIEVIVADGLSTDHSRQVAESYGARVVANGRQTVVAGRNRGFEQARGEFVAFTDADCVVSPEWLKSGLHTFTLDEKIAGVGGVTCFPDEATSFQKAVNFLFSLAGLAGATAHIQSAYATHYVEDIPGCNCLYRREALAQVMPVDENLLTAEDVWMNWLLRARGFRHAVSDHMLLWHHRRSRPRNFFRQMYRFAIGRLQAGKREPRLLSPLHVAVAAALPVGLAATAAAVMAGCGLWLPAVLGAAAALAFLLGLAKTRSWGAAVCVPPVLGIFLAAWSLGFLRELLFPLRQVDGK